MNREREKLEVAARKAKEVLEVWLRERKEQLEVRLAANAEVRRIWAESDILKAKASQ
ncbi:MAG TPA: hypothetical protein VEF04_21995 [Blastocatellia bacterium]|nr:hypothetical protein [Blastocatellia bacterium]